VNNPRYQDLSEIFTSIIKMMLRSIRAHGLRSIIHLPMLCLLAIELRRMGKQFAAVMAALDAGILRAPEPETTPQDEQAACAQPEAMPRPAAHPAVPAKRAAAVRTRAAPTVRRTRTPQATRRPEFAQPQPRRMPKPPGPLSLPAGVTVSGRST
jgi:hypothetical protein